MDTQDSCNIYGGFTIYAKWGEIEGDLLNQEDLRDALNNKVDKIEGKNLSENDYTNEDKAKVLSAIQGIKGNGTLINPDENRIVNVTPENIGAVPASRQINGKSLSSNITLFTYGTSNPSGGSSGDLYFKHG